MADLEITKQAAAQRQIDAAIRMLFLHNEDFTAIHTVASAARGILKDLADERGVGHLYVTRQALEDVYRDVMSQAKQAAETGQPLDEVSRAVLQTTAQYVVKVAGAKGAALGKVVHLDPDPTHPDISAALALRAGEIEKDKRTLIHRKYTENYLKHADRDRNQLLEIQRINPILILMDATNLWMNMNLPLTDEMAIFSQWFCGVTAENPDNFIITKGGPIHLFTFEQQIDFGRFMLKSAYRLTDRSATCFRNDAEYQLPEGGMFCALTQKT